MANWRAAAIVWLLFGILGPSVADSGARVLMPGDRIEIRCDQDQSLSVVRQISEDGTVDLPVVGSVGVATRTAAGAAEHIQALLDRTDLAASGRVTVRPIFTPGAPIEVTGAVSHSMTLRYVNPPDVKAMVSLAQPLPTADLDHLVVSHADGSETPCSLDGPFLRLEDGDRLVVPFLSGPVTVQVIGGVQTPSSVTFHRGLTLDDAIGAAGGFSARGEKNKIVITRSDEPIPASFSFDAKTVLHAGDTVSVGVTAEARFVAVQGDVVHPGLVDFGDGMTVTEAIKLAGGMKHGGTDGTVTVRTVLDPNFKPIRLSLKFIASGRIPDPVLTPGEVVDVRG